MKYWNATWNPIAGCTPISEGCRACWAKEMHERFHGKGSFDKVTLHEDRLAQPLRWRKPRVVFVNCCDPWHEDVPDEFLDRMLAVVALCPQHQFLLLTKRSKRMREYAPRYMDRHRGYLFDPEAFIPGSRLPVQSADWPLPNLWLGVTAENQQAADERIPDLLATPAAHRWISVEPMLGAVDLTDLRNGENALASYDVVPGGDGNPLQVERPVPISWIVVGGESGSKARPCNVDWIRGVVGQCKEAGVPCLVKQIGSYAYGRGPGCQWCFEAGELLPDTGCSVCGQICTNDRSGADPSEWPADLRVQQYPEGLQP